MSYLDYILLIIASIISVKIHYWVTLAKHVFKSETPLYFLKHPNLYKIATIVPFLLILIFTEILWYIIVISYLLSIFIGGILAGKKYREIVKEMQEERAKNKAK